MVNPWAVAVIVIIAGFAVVGAIEFIDKKLKVDDPVGACGAHMLSDSLGAVFTGVFCSNEALVNKGMTRIKFGVLKY